MNISSGLISVVRDLLVGRYITGGFARKWRDARQEPKGPSVKSLPQLFEMNYATVFDPAHRIIIANASEMKISCAAPIGNMDINRI